MKISNRLGDKINNKNIEDLISECDDLYYSEDYMGLIGKCDEVLEKYPDNPNAMGYKGIAHCFLDEYDDALKILERGVELYPNNYYLKNNLSMVYYDLGDYEKSLELCDEGLKIKDFDWLCENKLKALIKLDRLDEAVEFDKAFPHVSVNLGSVLLCEDRLSDALDYYYSILKDNPDDIILIDDIKMVIFEYGLDETPDVGDYYLKWIDNIKDVKISSDCDEFDFDCISVECEDLKFELYASYEIFMLTSKFRYLDCVELDEIKESLMLDDAELRAFLSRLKEIGYICEPIEGHFQLNSDL